MQLQSLVFLPYYLLLSITIRQLRAGFLLRVCVCRFECVCMLVRSCIKPCKHTTMFVLYHVPFSSLFPNTLLNRPIQLSSIILQHTVPKKREKEEKTCSAVLSSRSLQAVFASLPSLPFGTGVQQREISIYSCRNFSSSAENANTFCCFISMYWSKCTAPSV